MLRITLLLWNVEMSAGLIGKKVKCTLVQALRFVEAVRPIGGVEV